MLIAVQGEVFTDPTVARMRIWDADGVLQFSTDQSRSSIDAVQVDDPAIVQAATEGEATSSLVTAPFTFATTGRAGEPTRLLQTFSPMRVPDRIDPLGAVQIDFLYDALVERARDPWLQYQILFVGLSGLFILLLVLSFRRSHRLVGAGVVVEHDRAAPAVAAASTDDVPEGERDRVTALERELVAVRDELDVSREQLTQAEEAYRYLEGRLKKSQDEASTAPAVRAPADQDQRVAMIERERAAADERAAQAEHRLAELQQRLTRLAGLDPSLPPGAPPDYVPSVEPDVAPPASTHAPETPTSPTATPEGPTSPASTGGAARAPSEEAEEHTEEADQTDLRTRLARTAARKKLGPSSDS